MKKGSEIKELKSIITGAKLRIRSTSSARAGDFLKLLPNISISQGSPYSELKTSELYFSLSISTNQVFDITDKYKQRKALKRKALRQVASRGYTIEKYIERKYLVKKRIWKFKQIRGSMDNPVEIAKIDEKIDVLLLKLQEIEIDIEKAYADIEFLCVEVEG